MYGQIYVHVYLSPQGCLLRNDFCSWLVAQVTTETDDVAEGVLPMRGRVPAPSVYLKAPQRKCVLCLEVH